MSICLSAQVYIQINNCINNQREINHPTINKFSLVQHEKNFGSENKGIVVLEASFSGDACLCQMLVKDKLLIIMYDF